MNFSEKVWSLCREVPKGKVTTYGEIATALGCKGARAAGNALNKNQYSYCAWGRAGELSYRRQDFIPCHRVVRSDGVVGGFVYGTAKKIKMLESEGIKVRDGRIREFKKYFHRLK